MEKFYITTPIYYASARPHIGHAFATLQADVISRYKKLQGKEVFFLAGTDEHGAKIAEKAAEENKTPQEYVDEISSSYKEVWKVLDIGYSDFIRTTDPRHKEGVLKFIKKLFDSGAVYKDKYEGLYCIGCEKFLTEKDLVNGLCPDHLRPPEKISEENYFFDLQKYLPEVRRKIETEELKISPISRRNETLGFIEAGIDNFSISREKIKWGIPFPEDESQTIYVWVEALMNYVTALDFPEGEKYKKFWPADLHVIGAEINKFHTIFWPAMLLAIQELLPREIFVHGLIMVNGQKMSKTIGNIIDPVVLSQKFGVGGVRYLLLSQFPASEHGDIKEEEFVKKYNSDLVNGIGNLLERVFTMAIDYGFKYDNDDEKIDEEIRDFQAGTNALYSEKMNNYQLYEALNAVFSFTKKLDQYVNQKEPWQLFKNKDAELNEVLTTLIFGIEKIIVWLKPFMPLKMEQAEEYLKNLDFQKEKLNLFPRI